MIDHIYAKNNRDKAHANMDLKVNIKSDENLFHA